LTLRQFLNAAYTLMLEEWVRVGVGLEEALSNMAPWREGGPPSKESLGENIAAQNESAMEQLKQQMMNLQGAPI
jgi:hypothetical protein